MPWVWNFALMGHNGVWDMKIVFVSNYYNHHQKAISEAFYALLGENYRFISTNVMGESRKKLGYGMKELPQYVLLAYMGDDARQQAVELIREADVVISGSAPEDLIRLRIRRGGLVFRYSERPLKDGFSLLKYLPRVLRWNLRNPWWKPVSMLCASAYTAGDYVSHGAFLGRCYRWGYFPETKTYDIDQLMAQKDPKAILWAGRFLELKHADHVIEVARRLRDEGYDFSMTLIGMGELEQQLRDAIAAYGLQDCVRMPGAMKPEEVRSHMERAGIYLFTSDHREGWGAVLNESMNSGCAVVAAREIGSVPYLLSDSENGLIYPSADVDMLFRYVKQLLDDPGMQRRLGGCAYRTIAQQWNGAVAAERFLELAERIKQGEKHPEIWPEGPGSRDLPFRGRKT